ncbi:MAG: AbrB/MazE/SpoVT family DNA-binding domain-containing protein [Candidatus Magasanikbacteria bacterium]
MEHTSHSLDESCGHCVGTTSLGERGQVVIPKKVRESLHLKTGDNFVVMQRMGMVVLAPLNMVEDFIGNVSEEIKKLKK